MARVIGSLGGDQVTIGGRTLVGTVIALFGYADGGNKTTFRKGNGSSGYNPATTFQIKAVKLWGTHANSSVRLISSTNDIGVNVATAFVGEVSLTGNSAFQMHTAGSLAAEYAIDFTFANGNYLGMYSPGGSNTEVICYGYEV